MTVVKECKCWVSTIFMSCMLVGIFISSGCVRVIDEPLYVPKTITSRGGDGVVKFSWLTRVGYQYRLFISNPGGTDTNKAKRYNDTVYRGTGKIVEVTIQTDPNDPVVPAFSVTAEKVGQ